MMRTQISLTEEDRRLLDGMAARTGKSISALIRDAVSIVYGAERSTADDLAAMKEAFGCWAEREVGSIEYVDELRSGARLRQAQ
jgi:hypothetical protein